MRPMLRFSGPALGTLLLLSLGLADARANPTPVPLGQGWTAYGNVYAEPLMQRVGDTVYLSGLVKVASADGLTTPIGVLPAALRPALARVTATSRHDLPARVDVRANGEVAWVAGGTEHLWVSLSGLSWSVRTPTALTPADGWSQYGSGYAPAGFTEEGGIIRLQGLVKGSTAASSVVATLPATHRPAARLIFLTSQHTAPARVDVLPDGRVMFISGDPARAWLGLDGIAFAKASGTAVALGTGWAAYGATYQSPQATLVDGRARLGGLVKRTSGTSALVATLPAALRPGKSHIFLQPRNGGGQRVDVNAAGEIRVIGTLEDVWLSLDGIEFPVATPTIVVAGTEPTTETTPTTTPPATVEAPPVTSVPTPPGWEFAAGQAGKPAVLLIHGLAASSLHFTDPTRAWNVNRTLYDHQRPVGDATGTSDLPRVGLLALEASPADPAATADGSMWAYLVAQGFTVATWDQAPCIEQTAMPSGTCLDSDTFDAAYPSAVAALAKLASVTTADIALVGHSRGGLLVRRLLKDPATARSRVKTAITLHTPHQGTSIAGRGQDLQAALGNVATVVSQAIPADLAPAVTPLLTPLLTTPNALIDWLVQHVGLAGARQLAPNDPIYQALRDGESKPTGVRFYTFGGTSVTLWRLHAWFFTPESAVPANGYTARATQLAALPDLFPAAFDELKPGVGDLLVTDTSARLPWSDGHFTNTLNHGEVLWSRKVHRKVHELLLNTTLPAEPARAAYAPAVTGSVADLMAEARKLPVIGQLATTVETVASGEAVKIAPSVGGVALEAFVGGGAYHVGAGFTDPTLFALSDDLTAQLGAVQINSVAIVVSGADATLPTTALPAPLRPLVDQHASAGQLALRAGINVFAVVTPTDGGLVGVMKGAVGLGSGPIKMRGTLSADLFHKALAAAGVPLVGAAPAPTALRLELALPTVTPPPFNALNAKDALHVELRRPTITLERSAGTTTLSGSFDGHIWLRGEEVVIPRATLSWAHAASGSTLTVSGTAAMNLDPFGLGVGLKSLGLAGTFSTGATTAATLGVSAGIDVHGNRVEGLFSIGVSNPPSGPPQLDELSIAIPTGLALKDLGLGSVEGLRDITINTPALGLRPQSGEAWVAGGVSWPGRLSADGVLYVRRKTGSSGFALFARAADVDLAKLVGATLPFPLALPDLTLVVSTVSLKDVPLTDLPKAAREMVADVAANGKVSFDPGVAIVSKIDFTRAPFADVAGKLGLSGSLVIAGTVSGIGGTPSFTLRAALPTLSIPAPVGKVLTAVTPKLFIALAPGPELSMGVEADFGLNVGDDQNLTLRGKLYGQLGASGVGVKATGQLVGTWNAPFGLTGISFGNATVSLGAKADGSVDGGLGGTMSFGGKSYSMNGVFAINLATGIPTVKGIGFEFKADALSLLTPLEIGQTVVRAAAGALKGANLGLSTSQRTKLATVDVVSPIRNALPLSDVTLRDVTLFICTPGMSHPDFPQFSGFGFKAKGALTYGTTDLGSFDGYLTAADGFQLKTIGPKSLKLGPLTISNTLLDIGAGIPLLHTTPPRFIAKGDVSLLGFTGKVDVEFSAAKAATSIAVAWGGADLGRLGFTTVGAMPTPTDLRIDLLAEPGKLRDLLVSGIKALSDGGRQKVLDELATARAKVTTAETGVRLARTVAVAEYRSGAQALTVAQARVDDFKSQRSLLSGRLATARKSLDTALKRWPPDPAATAKLIAEVSALETSQLTLDGLLKAAEATLAKAKQGLTYVPIGLHPQVVAAGAALTDARIGVAALEATVAGLDGVNVVVDAVQKGLTATFSIERFALRDASLAGALRGEPQILELTFKLHGQTHNIRQNINLAAPGAVSLDDLVGATFKAVGGEVDPAVVLARVAALGADYAANALRPGQVVLLHSPGHNRYAQVVSGVVGTTADLTNFGRAKPVRQSSTSGDAVATRAVDGATGDGWASVSCTDNTAGPLYAQGGPAQFLQIDLGLRMPVAEVRVWSRTDFGIERMADLVVELRDEPCDAVPLVSPRAAKQIPTPARTTVLGFDISARYVCLMHYKPEHVSVAEVEVFSVGRHTSHQFRVVDAGGGLVALQSDSQKWLRVAANGAIEVTAQGTATLPAGATAELFRPTYNGDGTWSLWNPASKRFLRMNSAGVMDTNVRTDGVLPETWAWERFRVVEAP